MAKHLVVCGHGAGDPGAGGNGINERDFTRNELKPRMEAWAQKLKNNTISFYPVGQNLFQDTQRGGGAYSVPLDTASVTEIHLDSSSNPSATGGHVIVKSGLSADSHDLALAKVISDYVGWWGSVKPSQGISYRDNLLNCNVFATRPPISYRLIETGFISNATDVANIKANLDAIAKGFVEAITGERVAGSVPNPVPTPTPQPPKPALAPDQILTTGSTVKFGGVYRVDRVDIKHQAVASAVLAGGTPGGLNYIDTIPLVKTNSKGQRTSSQLLDVGDYFVIPGEYKVKKIDIPTQGALVQIGRYDVWLATGPMTETKN